MTGNQNEAIIGKVNTKKQIIFGYHLQLLAALKGLFLDFGLTTANDTDLESGFELIRDHTHLEVPGDKGFTCAEKAEELWRDDHIQPRTIPRVNQKQKVSKRYQYLRNAVCQLIETIKSQLSEQLGIEKKYAHIF